VVAPVLISILIPVPLRLLAQGTLFLPFAIPQYQLMVAAIMPWFDCVIFASFAIGAFKFRQMHYRARSDDKLIELLRAQEAATIARLREESKANLLVEKTERAAL
jgi:hypothetical protein